MQRWISGLLAALICVLLLAPAQAAAASYDDLTIGMLPTVTRDEEVMVRGTAPVGATVLLFVNGEPAGRTQADQGMSIYRAAVPVQPGLNLITATVEGAEKTATASLYRVTASFPDVVGDPLRDDMEVLATLGVVRGDESGAFRPRDGLTRAQLAKMIVLALGLEPAGPEVELPVTDADAVQPWARPYVATAYRAGLMSGYEDGSFRSNRQLTRAELVAIAVRAVPVGVNGAGVEPVTFTDRKVIPTWAQPAADRAAELGLVGSFWGNRFRASDLVSRREAAAVIRRLVDLVRR